MGDPRPRLYASTISRVRSTSRCICSISASRAGEAPLAAQALEELEAQRAAVQVAVEVEQVGLDQLAPAGLEGRAHADAHRRRAAVCEAGVHAVAGACERLLGDQVGGRKAQLAPALVAVHHLAAELEGRPEQPVGLAARSPASTRPRMWLEETISPSTSSSG